MNKFANASLFISYIKCIQQEYDNIVTYSFSFIGAAAQGKHLEYSADTPLVVCLFSTRIYFECVSEENAYFLNLWIHVFMRKTKNFYRKKKIIR